MRIILIKLDENELLLSFDSSHGVYTLTSTKSIKKGEDNM
jgi:hypothetical protein